MAQAAALASGEGLSNRLSNPGSDVRSRLEVRATFHAADVRALWDNFWLSIAALAVILVWITTLVGPYATIFYCSFFAGYIAFGYSQYLAVKKEQYWALTAWPSLIFSWSPQH